MKINKYEFFNNLIMTDIPSIEGRFLSLDYIRLDRFNHNKEENGLVYYQCITFSKEMVTF